MDVSDIIARLYLEKQELERAIEDLERKAGILPRQRALQPPEWPFRRGTLSHSGDRPGGEPA